MRIRSTKPEFWRSKTIGELDWDTRLVLKALESYVDDNGVGRDQLVIFCADAFPHDLAKSPEICAKVSRGLSRLSEAGLIVRYSIAGEPFIYVRRWKQWQYIDKPKAGRYPRPDGSMNYRDPVDENIGAGQVVTESPDDVEIREVSPQPPEDFANSSGNYPQIQSGEQGNRGTEEKPPSPPTDEPSPKPHPAPQAKNGAEIARRNFAAQPARSVGAYRIAEAFSASLPTPIESGLLSGIGVQIDKCLKRGIPPPAIAAGLQAWTESDSWSPTQIPNFVHKANNRRPTTNGKPTAKALGYDQALNELLAEVTTL